jgi:hypothetical protein
MKKLLLIAITCFITTLAYSQDNPYAIFGYKLKVQPKPSPVDIYKVTNHDTTSNIRYMIVNREDKIIKLLDDRDSVVKTVPYTAQDVFRWTSIDPHAEKYFSYSPYNYVFNNPVKMVDLNGMDGEVSGSGTKKDPYVIKANYYYVNGSLSDKQVAALNDGVASYNKMGGKDGVEIKNADGTKSYVKYSLSASGVKDAQAAKDAAYGDKFTDKGGTERYFGNIVGEGASGSGGDYGSATNRNVNFNNANIKDGIDNKGMNESRLLEGIVIHEIGHNLGGEHSDGTSTMSQITTNNIVRDIGPSSSYITYPSTSKDFTKIIFDRRDTRMQDPNARVLQPGLYTKQ